MDRCLRENPVNAAATSAVRTMRAARFHPSISCFCRPFRIQALSVPQPYMGNLMRRHLALLPVFLFILLSLLVLPGHAEQARWTYQKIGGDAAAGSASWCGNTRKVVWQGVNSGLHMADLSSGVEKIITTSLLHIKPFCSPDGRYVFFWDASKSPTPQLAAYDTVSRVTTIVECVDKNVSIAPNMEVAASTAKGCDEIQLPWGATIPVRYLGPVVYPGHYPPIIVGWIADNQRVVLGFTKKPPKGMMPESAVIAVYDFKNEKLSKISNLPPAPYSIKTSRDGRYIYFTSKDRASLFPPPDVNAIRLYRIDTHSLPLYAAIFFSDVRSYDIHESGGLAFIEYHGVPEGRLWLADTSGSSARAAGDELWNEGPIFSGDGNFILLMRHDPYLGGEGPDEPPATASVYVMQKN